MPWKNNVSDMELLGETWNNIAIPVDLKPMV